MSITTATLRDLHRIHTQLSDLRDRLARGPKQVKAHEGNVARVRQVLDGAKQDVQAARVAVDQKQLQLKTGEGKIEDLKVKLNSASSNREFQALKDQIAADEMAGSVLTDEILEGLEKIDELQSKIREAEEQVQKAEEELAKTRDAVGRQENLIKGDLSRLESELKRAEVNLAGEFRDAYRRLVGRRGADAMAEVEGECCGGCYQQLTPNMMNELYMARIVICGSCGRMLYLPEDRSVGGSG